MTKHLVDIDDDVLRVARAELGTVTSNDTVADALRLVARSRSERVARALYVFAIMEVDDRSDAWT